MGRRLFNKGAAALLVVGAVAVSGAEGAAQGPVRVLALGDSLTAGYGLPEPEGFTVQLEKALQAKGLNVDILNGGVSGDTTAGGRARLDWALGDKPQAVIVALGANDMLRGVDPGVARANLDAILKTLKERKLPALLVGMLAAPSLGPTYVQRFNAIYPELAREYDVPLYPFFLEGVATDAALNQGDGIHPSAAGVKVIVERIAPHVARLIESLPRTGG